MTFGRRLRLYGIGILLGVILSYMFLGDRLSNTAWMPKDRVRERLHSTLISTSEKAADHLKSINLTIDDVRETMQSAEILLGESTRTDDSLHYRVKSTVKGHELDMVIAALRDFDSDSTATLISIK